MSEPAATIAPSGGYAYPQRLVTTEWLSMNIGNPSVKIIESGADPLLYDIGHIPGAVRIDWRTDLSDPLTRDCIDGAAFATLMHAKGIARNHTVVIYGDRDNRWAAYTLWVFTLFGHDDVRLLDGGRSGWTAEDRETTLDVPSPLDTGYPTVKRNDDTARIFRAELEKKLDGMSLLDVRPTPEFVGAHSNALRAGHLPRAQSIPWTTALTPNGRFLSVEQLRAHYRTVPADQETVVYCHTGELAAHTWFTLTFLLGRTGVRCYDGSWAEWGNTVRAPISISTDQ